MAPDRPSQPGESIISASGKIQTYGYHNTFHTHASPAPTESKPPSYDFATSPCHGLNSSNVAESYPISEPLPDYDATIHFEGVMEVKAELATPFLISLDKTWHSVYVLLHGTQLSIYRPKSSSIFKSRASKPGRLIRTYSLQHAEVGLAVDWRKDELVPRSTFAKLLSKSAQAKLFETDPEFFEPVREFVFRMRLETEQMLFCVPDHGQMLDWVEQVVHQEQLFQRYYPNLAANSMPAENTADRSERTEGPGEASQPNQEQEGGSDPDAEDLDPADAREESDETNSSPPNTAHLQASSQSLRAEAQEPYNPKTSRPWQSLTEGALLRFRRRCAPILLASSPRASPIVFRNDARYQIHTRRRQLVPFELLPPHYNAHANTNPPTVLRSAFTSSEPLRPSFSRGISGASRVSRESTADVDIEEEASSLHSTSILFGGSNEELDRVSTVESQAPSAKGKGKAVLIKLHKVRPASKRSRSQLEGVAETATSIAVATHTPLLV